MSDASRDLGRRFVSDASIRSGEEVAAGPVVEETYDPRPLYEKLMEQRQRYEEQQEEKFKFKGPHSLDEDEANFLNDALQKQRQMELQQQAQEQTEIERFKVRCPCPLPASSFFVCLSLSTCVVTTL